MNNSTSSKNKNTHSYYEGAQCPKCGEPTLVVTFPNSKKPLDFECTNCGCKIHVEPNVTVE